MIKLKLNGVYKTNNGDTVTIIETFFNTYEQKQSYTGSNDFYYNENGYLFGFPQKDDPDRIVSEVTDDVQIEDNERSLEIKSTVESSDYSLTHSDIQLLRNTLISRLNNLEFLIWENEDWSKRLYRQATPESADGIAAFHELNKCKYSIRYCKKERKHVAELLRKLKKQQAELLRNSAKV